MLRLAACLRLLRLSRAAPPRSAFPSQAWDGPSLESGLRLLDPLRVCCSDVLRPQLTRDEFPLSPQTSCDTRLMSAWESREETFWKVFLSCLPVCTFRYLQIILLWRIYREWKPCCNGNANPCRVNPSQHGGTTPSFVWHYTEACWWLQCRVRFQPHLSEAPQRSRVVPAECCTPAWRCCRRWGHRHLSLSPASLTYLRDKSTDTTVQSGDDSASVIRFRNSLTNKHVTENVLIRLPAPAEFGCEMKNTLPFFTDAAACAAPARPVPATISLHFIIVGGGNIRSPLWWFSTFLNKTLDFLRELTELYSPLIYETLSKSIT